MTLEKLSSIERGDEDYLLANSLSPLSPKRQDRYDV